MRKTFVLLFSVLLLGACSIDRSIPGSRTSPANSQNCAYAWDTQPLPDLTEFRASVKIKGRSLTDELLAMRREERH